MDKLDERKQEAALFGAASGNYYSRPESSVDTTMLTQKVGDSFLQQQQTGVALKQAESALQGTENTLAYLQHKMEKLSARGAGSGELKAAQARYDSLYKQYRTDRLRYMAKAVQHEDAVKIYDAANAGLQHYLSEQETAEKQWRSTIRESGTVKAELDEVRRQIQELRQQDSTGNTLSWLGNVAQNALVSSSGFAVPWQQYTPQNAQRIAELQAREKLLQEEYQWGMQFEDEALRGSDEFKTAAAAGMQAYEQHRAEQQAHATSKTLGQKVLDSGAAAFGAGNDNPALAAWLQAAQQYREDDSYRQPNDKWSQAQKDMFGYYYSSNPQKAFEYAEQVNNQINQEKAQTQKDSIAQKATESGWAGVGHTIGALATAPLALADVMDNLAEFAGRGTVTSKDSVTPYDYSQAVVGGISKKLNESGTIDESVPVIGGKGLGDLYGIGFSTAQSLIAGATGNLAGTGALTLLQFFGQGAAAGIDSGIESGAKGWQALTYGLISGAAEGFAEKIGVDRLFKLGSARTFKGFVKNLLKQSAAEGIEETVTAVLDSAADRIILGENSTFRKAVSEYEQSMSHEDAVRLAWTQTIGGIVFDGLSGAIAGGLGAGVTTTGANVLESIHDHRQAKPAATETMMQGTTDLPAVTEHVIFQEEVQRQVAENLGGEKTAQRAAAELAAPTVQVSREMWQQGQRLAQITGRKLKFYEGVQNENGFFDSKTGEIWVNAKGGDPLAQVFSHELTHSIEQAGVYNKLSSLVLNRMQDTGMDLDTAREAKWQQYQRQGRPLPSAAAVDQELVAEYVSKHLLTDETAIRSLVQQDRSLGQKIHDFFDRLLAKLGNKNAQERAFLSRAKNIYAKALRQTQNVGTAQTVEQKATAAATEGAAAEAISLDDLDAQLAAGEITEEEYDEIRDEHELLQEEQYSAGERKYSFRGYADDGKGIYESNFPKGTPKKAKGERILRFIQDVWSKKPITLRIEDGGKTQYIEAQFDPTYSEDKNLRSDASKLMGGNRHGNAAEKRVTLDLADDYYQIAAESKYNYSKDETGKDSEPHKDVKRWHYFVNDIYFAEQGSEELIPYRVSINVKEKGEGHYFYSFSAEKAEGTSTQRTLHAAVNDSDNTTANGSSSKTSIYPTEEEVKKFSLAGDVTEDSTGRKLVAGQIAYFRDSKARDALGRLLVLFHQTGEVFTIFDVLRQGAGTNDSGTPFGVFMKSSSADIGLQGKHQMELYANITNPIYAIDRADLKNQIEQLSPEYAAIARELSELDAVYSAKVEDAKSDLQRFMEEWRKANPDASRRALYDIPEFDTLFSAEDAIVDEWTEKADELSKRAKKVLTQALRNAGYDGVILKNDAGSFGRNTDAYIALDPAQIKNVDNLEPTADPDLRYSLAEVEEEVASDGAKSDADYLDAVSRGDTAAAQKMVDEAAKAAGYSIKAYHGTSSEFTTFQRGNKRTRGSLNFGSGFYFSPSRSFAENYTTTGRVIEGYIKLENPYEVFGTRFDRSDLEGIAKDAGKEVTIENVTQILQQLGYDGIIAKDYNGTTNPVNQYVIFDANQVKSADPVTYDDKGNVISLSERFNSGSNDIRYSLADEAESVSEEKPEEDAPEAKPDLRSSMPRKAAEMLKRTERELLWAIADRLSVPKLAGREYLTPIIQEMADEYLEKGSISPETRQLLFEKAYSQAVIVDGEFYKQYKHIKDHLRTTPVTISDRDKLDIADFNDFRKRAFGSLKIVNEGGLPVDSAYQELHSLAPELFPESITHPADQLMRMFDVGKSIQVTEQSVRDYYGQEEPEYRKWAQNEFEEAIGNITGKLWEVKRYAEAKVAKDTDAAPATEEEAMEAYQKLKKARRDYEKVNAKNLLTERDQIQVGRLLRHEIELDHLQPGVDNIKGIAAVFEAKQEYDKLCKLVAEYKRHLRGKAKKEADALLKTANDWKDKKVGIAYSRETMERNVFDIVKDKLLAQKIIDKYFAPVHKAEAAAARFKNDYRDRVRAMQLSQKVAKGNLVSEAHAVQLLGEAQDNIRMLENARGRIKQRDGKNRSEWEAVVQNLWLENPNLDKSKIEGAVKAFRKIYDELFQQMNKVRVANGYEPVNYRNGYFPHFQPGDSDSILAQFGRALGIDTRIDSLPTTINGLTHTFKPGIQWFGNAQERLGFNTAYDAVEGFDKYIEGVANVIHHTQNIQNLRALASQIRYRTSDEGIRQQVDDIYERQGLTDEEKQQLIQEIYSHGKFALSNFVTELDEYTNLLAGKKSRYDRSIEAAMGRRAYTFLKAWEARVGANMIAGNLTSALTNFIPLTQAGAQMSKKALLNGMLQTLQSYRSDDGMAGMSTFLTNRRGSDPLVRTWAQNASNVLGKPMELIDGFVAGSIVRGAYLQNLRQGLNEVDAMDQADAFAASVMADRSKGAMPTLLQSSNPLFKAFTQFQLEVNNQFSEVFKDIPRRFKEKGLATLAWVLLQYFLGALLYNELYEKLIGRRPALDPIGMLCQAYDDLQTDGFGTAGKNLAVNALEQLPFSSGLTLIGVELDGGRIPASSAVPDFTALWDAATTEGWSAEKRWKEVQDELNKLAYVVTPFGGNQVSKIWKGVKAYFQGGSYNVDAEGNDIMQYPVYKDEPKDAFWSLVKAAFLGKSSLNTAQDWVDSGFDSLGAKQTAAYQDMIAAGVKDRDAYGLLQAIQNAQETKASAVQRDVLRASGVSGDGKAIVYYGLLASDKERDLMDLLADMGADAGAVATALMDLKDAGSKANEKLVAISKAKLADEEKTVLVGSVIGTDLLTESGGLTQYAKFDYAVQNGMSVDQYIGYRASGASIDDYLELRDAGATVEDAMETGIALEDLRNSVEDPTTIQKWRVVIDSTDDPEKQFISLSVVMTDSQYAKVVTARGFGVSPKAYVQANELLQKYDADGNGSFTQAEVTRAVSAMKVSHMQKAVLWQLLTGSSSAKNNPYNTVIGQQVINTLKKEKETQDDMPTFEEEIMRQIMANMGK